MIEYGVARAIDVPDRRPLIVNVGSLEIGLFRVGDGIRAWRNHCPHMAAPVCRGVVTGTMLPTEVYRYRYGRDGEVLQCPWHGWEFDLDTGRHLAPSSTARLRGYPVNIVNGVVMLQLAVPPRPSAAR